VLLHITQPGYGSLYYLFYISLFQAGLIYGSLMFVVAYLVVVITVLSISAIATNGVVKGGGAYCILIPLFIEDSTKNI